MAESIIGGSCEECGTFTTNIVGEFFPHPICLPCVEAEKRCEAAYRGA
jgi:hypothetical protein